MAIEKFHLATLSALDDGRVRRAFDQALQRCLADCEDRPGLKEKRTVKLCVSLTPLPSPEGSELETCDVEFEVVDGQPKRRSKTYNMRATPGGLFFNELSPEDVRQRTLDEAPRPVPTTRPDQKRKSDAG